MSDLIDIVRAVIRDELRALRLADIGVVISVFPHAEGDTHNHECSVQLRESELELRKVPIAIAHVGMVSAPRVGDLVLINYVGGDPNRPIVVGRMYSDEANPPEHQENELIVAAPYDADDETSIKIDAEQSIIVKTGKNVVTGEANLNVIVSGDVNLECENCTIDASGEVNLGANGDPVITEGSHKCYYSGAPLVGAASVKAKNG